MISAISAAKKVFNPDMKPPRFRHRDPHEISLKSGSEGFVAAGTFPEHFGNGYWRIIYNGHWWLLMVNIIYNQLFWIGKSTIIITGWWFGTMEFYDFQYIGNFIIPIDELHHFSRWLSHHQPVMHGFHFFSGSPMNWTMAIRIEKSDDSPMDLPELQGNPFVPWSKHGLSVHIFWDIGDGHQSF